MTTVPPPPSEPISFRTRGGGVTELFTLTTLVSSTAGSAPRTRSVGTDSIGAEFEFAAGIHFAHGLPARTLYSRTGLQSSPAPSEDGHHHDEGRGTSRRGIWTSGPAQRTDAVAKRSTERMNPEGTHTPDSELVGVRRGGRGTERGELTRNQVCRH